MAFLETDKKVYEFLVDKNFKRFLSGEKLDINNPDDFLLKIKVLYGGRAGGKTINTVNTLLQLLMKYKIKVIIYRNYQTNLEYSIHADFVNAIHEYGLSKYFIINKSEIRYKYGGVIFFAGYKINVIEVKGTSRFNIALFEESAQITKDEMDILLPTFMRHTGTQVWFLFNPEFDEDYMVRIYVNKSIPDSYAKWTRVKKLIYSDNLFLTPDYIETIESKRDTDEADFSHIYLGNPKALIEGAVYGKEMTKLLDNGHITTVTYLPHKPVSCFFDIGRQDGTAIWFIQENQLEIRVFDHFFDRFRDLEYYLQVLQDKHYHYENLIFPHDGDNHNILSQDGLNVVERTKKMFPNANVKTVLRTDTALKIDMVRGILPDLWFDSIKCADGISHLKKYHYNINDRADIVSRAPVHDSNSHSADALGTYAIWLKHGQKKRVTYTDIRYKPLLNNREVFIR